MAGDSVSISAEIKGQTYEFDCAAGEPLLYAGLRAGVPLAYECATGTCGACRATLKAGRVSSLWPDAPGHSQLQGKQNAILLCQSAALESCTLKLGPMHHRDTPRVVKTNAVVVRVEVLNDAVVALTLTLHQSMVFMPGQFVAVQFTGVAGYRALSIANTSPADELRFFVKRRSAGELGRLLTKDITGSSVTVVGPLGKSYWAPAEMRDVVCAAGSTGIAPMLSIAADWSRKSAGTFLHLFFGVRTASEVFYLDYLNSFAKKSHEHTKIVVALSDEDRAPPDLMRKYRNLTIDTGFVSDVMRRQLGVVNDRAVAFVAGPPPMVDASVRTLISDMKVPADLIRYDRFS